MTDQLAQFQDLLGKMADTLGSLAKPTVDTPEFVEARQLRTKTIIEKSTQLSKPIIKVFQTLAIDEAPLDGAVKRQLARQVIWAMGKQHHYHRKQNDWRASQLVFEQERGGRANDAIVPEVDAAGDHEKAISYHNACMEQFELLGYAFEDVFNAMEKEAVAEGATVSTSMPQLDISEASFARWADGDTVRRQASNGERQSRINAVQQSARVQRDTGFAFVPSTDVAT